MNEFIEQFILESRELTEHATADLLALEKAPDDKEHIDGAFRAFHTLKGGAGIVDFTAMAHAVHAAEDLLSGARSGTRAVTTQLIGDCLTCLDQIVQWLDTIESTGDLPKNAEAQAATIAARFAGSHGVLSTSAPPPMRPAAEDWIESLLARHATLREKARTAVRYLPERDCFYEGVDPLACIAALPRLLAVHVEPTSPWPSLDVIDPFVCNLVVTALTESLPSEVIHAMDGIGEQCDIQALVSAPSSVGQRMSVQAREVLVAQLALIGEAGGHGATGRIASAGVVAANILRHAGRAADAYPIVRAAEISLAENTPRYLREAIEATLNETSSAAVSPTLLAPAPTKETTTRTLRVDAARVDALVNLTGELTVAKNSIAHATKLAQDGDPELAAILKQRYAVLDRLVGELQQSVLRMRVLPLRHVLQRFPRLLREMSDELCKPATLVIDGGDTEADKAIIEMLFDPLLHVLRNAMDHGVEDASTRAARGKPSVANIRLSAGRQGEHVVVEVSDDGRGIDVARIRQVALARNMMPAEVLADMSDAEAIDLIFKPGFSTAGEVTELSGRGVGMDVVRTAVQRLAGRVSIDSNAGQGTTIRFTLPFSVMVTRVMVVGAGDQIFGIPLDAVVETLRIDAAGIIPIGSAHAIVLRNRTIPLVVLANALGLTVSSRHETEAIIVVAKIDGHDGALHVDRIGERMEVMLKPLDGLLAGMHGLAGSTVLGDGSVLLILDLAELFR